MKTRYRYVITELIILQTFLASFASCTSTPPSVFMTPTSQSSQPTPTVLPATATAEIITRTDRLLFGRRNWYALGVNYPWLNYGHDFGTTQWGHDGISSAESRNVVDTDFEYLQSQGVHVVRWFLFADGRASPEFDVDGRVTGLDEYFYDDLDAALEIAQKHNIYIIFVLFDFHLADKANLINDVQVGGRSHIITDTEKQQAFIDNALKPLLDKYGENQSILAWEVINEPEGAMNIPGGQWVEESVSATAMQVFVKKVVTYIHTYSIQYATVGSASRQWLDYWIDSDLDFYQYHYYDKMESQYPLDYPYTNLKLDKPCLIGEFPTKNTNRTSSQFLDTIWNNGYAGALAWSYRANDDASDFSNIATEFKAWSEAHQVDVQIGSSK